MPTSARAGQRRSRNVRVKPRVEGLEQRALMAVDLPTVDTGQLPYTLKLEPVTIPDAPALQSAVSASVGGKWILFGGRTNGLHGFGSGQNFPPEYQNREIYVIDPKSGKVWSRPWSDSSLSTAAVDALTSSNQESYVKGNRLYAVGGYGVSSATNVSTTFDTLTSINLPGLVRSVVHGGDLAKQVRQIHDSRLAVTGGEMNVLGNRTYLVMGQNFQGDYFAPDSVQKYTDEVRSFQIVENAHGLSIRNYAALTDPLNFHRRDYNLSPEILPGGSQALLVHGGVFTPGGSGYREPILVSPSGTATVVSYYRQYFSQYKTTSIPLYSARTQISQTLSLGGISLYTYDPTSGQIAEDPNLPFINTISTLQESPTGTFLETILPEQLPALLGAESMYFASPNAPHYGNGVVSLDRVHRPTTLGFLYGGIVAQQPNNGPSTASSLIFRIILTPRRPA